MKDAERSRCAHDHAPGLLPELARERGVGHLTWFATAAWERVRLAIRLEHEDLGATPRDRAHRNQEIERRLDRGEVSGDVEVLSDLWPMPLLGDRRRQCREEPVHVGHGK